ncbi:sigma-70 family RNA polymerase sigma factor [Listeria booriae]|uniref:sigma-70 family RNA polymerase sigma factor n=1 Tax=Listeria booriae TaxID=1552123 RepID=UPI00162A26DC|nr:sigma-70 family RNA polymerase sigma factor [Listeria booriae]MBC1227603.1 sigma-70 family RNA polymerase sigma factor [Listeria booriae]
MANETKLNIKIKKLGIQRSFDYFCKKVIKNEKLNYERNLRRQRKYEISLSLIEDLNRGNRNLSYTLGEEHIFSVNGMEVVVLDDILADGLSFLEPNDKDILLLSYFLNLTDEKIAEQLSISRRTLTFWRHKALNDLQKKIKYIREDGGIWDGEKKG